jgi:integrase/recombinase XerD
MVKATMSNKTELTTDDLFTAEEQEAMLSTALKKAKLGRTRYSFGRHTNLMITHLLLRTGLRATELCSVTISQAKKGVAKGEFSLIGKGALHTNDPIKKKKATRQVVIPTELQAMIASYLEKREQQYSTSNALFIGRNGQPFTRFSLWHRVKTIQKQSGIEDTKRTHSFRHTYGQKCYELSKDILTTSALMGHKSTITTQIYVKATDKAKRNLVEML